MYSLNNKFIELSTFLVQILLFLSGKTLSFEPESGDNVERPVTLTDISIGGFRWNLGLNLNALSMCPAAPRDGNENLRAGIILYSPKKFQDSTIKTEANEWTGNSLEKLMKDGFDLNKRTLIYSFGYTQNPSTDWLLKMRSRYKELALKRKTNFNLLVFDWSAYSRFAYPTSASYVPYLGRQLASFIGKLANEYSYDLDKINLIGYSLSTHIMGYAARVLKESGLGQVGQLTLIDPTGVCFHDKESAFAREYSVRAEDAKLTVAKHYDFGRFGSRQSIGHVDIYVNGGSGQPSYGPRAGGGGFSSDHGQAAEHESQRATRDCQTVAYRCKNYDTYLKGACASCGLKGEACFNLNSYGRTLRSTTRSQEYKLKSIMYVKTDSMSNCPHHYQLRLNTRSRIEASELEGLQIQIGKVKLNSPSYRLDGKSFTSLVTSKELANILNNKNKTPSIKISLNGNNSRRGGSISSTLKKINSLEVNYMSHTDGNVRSKMSAKFCPTSNSEEMVKC